MENKEKQGEDTGVPNWSTSAKLALEEIINRGDKQEQMKLLCEIIKADEKDGLYEMNITQEQMENRREYIIDDESKTITIQHDMVDDFYMELKNKYPTYTIQYGLLL